MTPTVQTQTNSELAFCVFHLRAEIVTDDPLWPQKRINTRSAPGRGEAKLEKLNGPSKTKTATSIRDAICRSGRDAQSPSEAKPNATIQIKYL